MTLKQKNFAKFIVVLIIFMAGCYQVSTWLGYFGVLVQLLFLPVAWFAGGWIGRSMSISARYEEREARN